MTKMRSKKMTKSTFAVIIMAILMVAMLAFGGTYAYFTAASDATEGNITTGTLIVGGSLTFTATENSLVPNQTAMLSYTEGDNTYSATKGVTVEGTTWAAYRLEFKITKIEDTLNSNADVTADRKAAFTIDILDGSDASLVKGDDNADTATWELYNGYYYYKMVNTGTGIGSLDQIAPKLVISLDKDAQDEYQGLKVTYTITFQAAQAEYAGDNTTGYTQATVIAAADAAELTWVQPSKT